MRLRTVLRDCLYLNWALPADALPDLPPPLRYELHPANGRSFVFATAVLSFQDGLRLPALPWARLAYPQANLRLSVLAPGGVPAVYFVGLLVPAWVVPAARLVARHPVVAARLRFARPSREREAASWGWEIEGPGRLAVIARPGSPAPGPGPSFASWEAMVRLLRERSVGYSSSPSGLRRVETAQPTVAVWPLAAEVSEGSLLDELLPLPECGWPPLHSAFLCPEVPLDLVLRTVPEVSLADRVPAPG